MNFGEEWFWGGKKSKPICKIVKFNGIFSTDFNKVFISELASNKHLWIFKWIIDNGILNSWRVSWEHLTNVSPRCESRFSSTWWLFSTYVFLHSLGFWCKNKSKLTIVWCDFFHVFVMACSTKVISLMSELPNDEVFPSLLHLLRRSPNFQVRHWLSFRCVKWQKQHHGKKALITTSLLSKKGAHCIFSIAGNVGIFYYHMPGFLSRLIGVSQE